MTRELILYVGLHKTASSSIQHTCAANQARLEAAGFTYPVYSLTSGVTEVNHSRALRNIFRRDPARMGLGGQLTAGTVTWGEADREQLKSKFIAALTSSGARGVLAAEALSVFSIDELEAVKRWLESAGFRLRVICHVRHIASWLTSMVAQRVRGQAALTIGEAVREMVDAGGIVKPRLEVVRAVFPQAEFFSHETAVAHPLGPPGFFLETIGMRETGGLQWERVNEGASDLTVRTMSVLNERYGSMQVKRPLQQLARFMNEPGPAAIQRLRGPKFRVTVSEAAPLGSLIASENAWLRDELGAAFHDPDPSFAAKPLAPSPEQRAALTAAIALCKPRLRQWLESRLLAPPTGIEPVSSA